MIGWIRRALDRRRAVRETAARLLEQMGNAAWKHARDQADIAKLPADRAFWRKVQSRIEAHDDRKTRISVRRRRRAPG